MGKYRGAIDVRDETGDVRPAVSYVNACYANPFCLKHDISVLHVFIGTCCFSLAKSALSAVFPHCVQKLMRRAFC